MIGVSKFMSKRVIRAHGKIIGGDEKWENVWNISHYMNEVDMFVGHI